MPQARDEDGNVWEVDAQGNAISLVQAANGGAQPLTQADPVQQQREAAQTTSAQANARVDSATVNSQIALANAQAAQAQAQANQAIAAQNQPDSARPDITSGTFSEAMQGFTASMALSETIASLEQRFQDGPGSTSGVAGLLDYLPTETNSRFNRAANAARGTVGDVLGFTGGQLNSVQEAEMNVGPFIPQADDKDGVIQDSIERLRDLQQQGLDRSIAILGGVPDASGNITPIEPGTRPTAQTIGEPDPALNQTPFEYLRTDGGRGPETQATEFGGTTESIPAPPEMVREADQMVARMASENGGRLDPQAYAQARAELDQKYNRSSDPEANAAWATSVNDYLDAGGVTIPTGIQSEERTLSQGDFLRNSAVSNPVGGAAVGFTNGATAGLVGGLAPDQASALSDAYPLSSLAGEVGGSVLGAGAIGGLARTAAKQAAPRLLGGGTGAQLGRNVATDAAYASVYGANSGDDIATAGALGAGGSLVGQGLGKAIGAGVGGLARTEPAQALIERGIRLSTGRQLGGGASRFEDLLQSVPVVGGQVRARQLDSFQDLQTAALREAGEPIGFNPTRGGPAGLDDLGTARSNFYDETLSDVNAPLGEEFIQDMAPVADLARGLSDRNSRKLGETINDAMQIPADAGAITGPQYQDALVALKRLRNNPGEAMPNSARTLQDAASQSIGALDNAVTRGAGPEVVDGLSRANQANRSFKTLEDAMLDKAAGGSQTGELFLPTPNQLQRAGRSTQKRYPGPRPFAELADQGQQVLPSTVPNSGTADRTMAAAALGTAGIGGVGALGGGAGYAFGGAEGVDDGALAGAGLAGALALLGTRRGQQLVQKALLDRPQAAQNVGQAINRRRGLFGSAGGRLALEAQ